MRWRLAHPQDTAFLRFDDEALVFNPESWETHFLNDSAAFVLESLLDRPHSIEEIVAEVSRASAAPMPDEFSNQVAELLRQLEALGLVSAHE
jgi:PqqD family protein of HPr-rel-A system